jgi:GxxExxY protein
MQFQLVDLASAKEQFPELTSTLDVIAKSAQEVWTRLGCGHSEMVYQKALEHELRLHGTSVVGQSVLPVDYKGVNVGFMLPDLLLLEQNIVIELKSVVKNDFDFRTPEVAQLAAYVRLLKVPIGLLINFPKTLTGMAVAIVALVSSLNKQHLESQEVTKPSSLPIRKESPSKRTKKSDS